MERHNDKKIQPDMGNAVMKYVSYIYLITLSVMLTACLSEKDQTENSESRDKSIPVHVMEIESRELPTADCNAGTGVGERQGDRFADPPAGAGDESHLV